MKNKDYLFVAAALASLAGQGTPTGHSQALALPDVPAEKRQPKINPYQFQPKKTRRERREEARKASRRGS